jgi:hypothetical protein
LLTNEKQLLFGHKKNKTIEQTKFAEDRFSEILEELINQIKKNPNKKTYILTKVRDCGYRGYVEGYEYFVEKVQERTKKYSEPPPKYDLIDTQMKEDKSIVVKIDMTKRIYSANETESQIISTMYRTRGLMGMKTIKDVVDDQYPKILEAMKKKIGSGADPDQFEYIWEPYELPTYIPREKDQTIADACREVQREVIHKLQKELTGEDKDPLIYVGPILVRDGYFYTPRLNGVEVHFHKGIWRSLESVEDYIARSRFRRTEIYDCGSSGPRYEYEF